jgi:hypothetical protein
MRNSGILFGNVKRAGAAGSGPVTGSVLEILDVDVLMSHC